MSQTGSESIGESSTTERNLKSGERSWNSYKEQLANYQLEREQLISKHNQLHNMTTARINQVGRVDKCDNLSSLGTSQTQKAPMQLKFSDSLANWKWPSKNTGDNYIKSIKT